MPPRTRSAPAAFGRGISQVVANPWLLLAPLASGGATAAFVAGAAACVFLLAGGALASIAAAFRRGPAALSDFFEDLRSGVFASPGAVLLVLLSILVAVFLLTALAAWIRAGVTGCLAQADALAPEGAPLAGFRLPALGPAFFGAARSRFGAFFALVNLYGLVASFLAVLVFAPLAGVVVAALARRTALLAFCGLLLALLVPLVIVAAAALRAAYLVAGRTLATEPVDCLAAVARALALLRECPGRAATLYLLCVAGGFAVGLAFVVPRMLATFAAGALNGGFAAVLAVSTFFIVLQVAAGFAYDLAVTGSFVALWPQDVPGGESAPGAPFA